MMVARLTDDNNGSIVEVTTSYQEDYARVTVVDNVTGMRATAHLKRSELAALVISAGLGPVPEVPEYLR